MRPVLLPGLAVLALAAPAAAAPFAPDPIRTEPGSSAAAAASAQGGPSVLTYAALGLSGLAVVLAGSALAVAAGGRRGPAAPAEPPRLAAAADPRVADRLARLESALRDLSEAAARRPPPPAPPALGRDPFPPSAPDPRPAPAGAARAAAPSAASPPASAERLPEWVEGVKARFARLALDPSSAAAPFIAELSPRGALAGPDGVALLDAFEGAKLWAVRAPGEAEVWALTPGEQAVLNWSAHFAPHRTRVAAEVFGEAFDLVDGGGDLRLEEPALVSRDLSNRLSVRRRGRLSGFRG